MIGVSISKYLFVKQLKARWLRYELVNSNYDSFILMSWLTQSKKNMKYGQ